MVGIDSSFLSSRPGCHMKTRAINPTEWLKAFHLNQAIEVTGSSRTLYLSGQTSNGPDGAPMHEGDLVAQFRLAWSNLKDALAEADMDATNVVRLNIYTTDVDAFMSAAEDVVPIWAGDGCMPTCTLLGVDRLFEPELMVELEATAVA
jgi:enamine deaminase RidA (YjgF/YER057c/UK114 family)